jgi:hypothetical protein
VPMIMRVDDGGMRMLRFPALALSMLLLCHASLLSGPKTLAPVRGLQNV